MAKYIIKDSTMIDIGDAIREQTGNANQLSPARMVDEIGGYLGDIKGLVGRTLTEINHGGVDSIAPYAFYRYSTLTSVEFPNCTSVGNSAFTSCAGLNYVSLPKCTSASTSAFTGCTKITDGTLGFEGTIASTNLPFKVAQASLIRLSFPACTSISASTFAGSTTYQKLQEVYAPECLSVGANAFASCVALNTVYLPKCASASTTAFTKCTKIANATIGFSQLTSDNNPFKVASSSLREVHFPECGFIGLGAFCSSTSSGWVGYSTLAVADFPVCSKIYAHAFAGCSSLTSISFPMCTTIQEAAFINCINLTDIYIPACETIEVDAFRHCPNITSISLPTCSFIGRTAFYGCNGLTRIALPSVSNLFDNPYGLTNAVEVFGLCRNLKEVDLPVCSHLGYLTFASCTNLTTLILRYSSIACYHESSPADLNILKNTPILDSSYTGSFGSIYVPASLVDAYKIASQWSACADRITAIVE